MDFMPLPDGVPSHEPVPELRGRDYDNQGFLGYDQRQGWTVHAIRKGDLVNARKDWTCYHVQKGLSPRSRSVLDSTNNHSMMLACIASFVQTWVLYGIFQEALSRPIRRHELTAVRPRSNNKAAPARISLPQRLAQKLRGGDEQSRSVTVQPLFEEFLQKLVGFAKCHQRAFHLLHCIRQAAHLLYDIAESSKELTLPIVPPRVLRALFVILRAIEGYVIFLLPLYANPRDYTNFASADYDMRMELERQGWCSCLVKRIRYGLGVAGLYYASLLKRPDNKSHDKCRTGVCIASNIDSKMYVPQHVREWCLCTGDECAPGGTKCYCATFSVTDAQLHDALSQGGFPLVRANEYWFEIIRFTPGMKYVALSHVWSDGRGNPCSNALPICQLRQLNDYVKNLNINPTTPFWIDSLCVPVTEPLRNTAIMGMASVYSSATSVLVLSAELTTVTLPSTADEIAFRIFCSSWNTRLWTLQEAALATDLIFQFRDQAIGSVYLQEVCNDRFRRYIEKCHLVASWGAYWLEKLELFSHYDSSDDRFGKFCSALRFRSTSRALDVAICGSIILGSGLEDVLNASNAEKMEIFWSCRPKVSAAILWNSGSRLKKDGLRWALSDLLEEGSAWGLSNNSASPMAEINASGLLVTGVEAILMENFDLPKTGRKHICRVNLGEIPQRYILSLESTFLEALDEIRTTWAGSWALLLPEIPSAASAITAAVVAPLRKVHQEDCAQNSSPAIPARYIGTVDVVPENGVYTKQSLVLHGERTDFDELVSVLADLPDSHMFTEITEARRLPLSCRWCVS